MIIKVFVSILYNCYYRAPSEYDERRLFLRIVLVNICMCAARAFNERKKLEGSVKFVLFSFFSFFLGGKKKTVFALSNATAGPARVLLVFITCSTCARANDLSFADAESCLRGAGMGVE